MIERHGHWMKRYYGDFRLMNCSICGYCVSKRNGEKDDVRCPDCDCRMDEKTETQRITEEIDGHPLCPYCGAEMESENDTGEYTGASHCCYECHKCGSISPIIYVGDDMDMCEGIRRAREAAFNRHKIEM